MAHVLIGFAEALPAPEVVFSLRAAGHEVSAFGRTAALPLARLPLRGLHVLPDLRHHPDAAVAAVQALMAGPEAPDVVLPLDDAWLWLVDAALGADPRVAGATGDQARIALDKRRQCELARHSGLNVPETVILEAGSPAPAGFPLPAIVKPALAVKVGPQGLEKGPTRYLLADADRAGLDDLATRSGQPFLMQPLIAGTGEGIFGFATAEGVLAWSAHRRVRMMNPHGSGSSACAAERPDPEACAGIARFMAACGWRGPFMMEFLRDADGRLWFMELNGRMWGSLALARRQGLEYPAWAVAAQADPGFRPVPLSGLPPLRGPARNLGRDLLHLLFVLRGPRTAFHRQGWPRFWHSLRGVLAPAPLRQFYNHDPAHRGYVLRDTVWTLRQAFKR